MNNLRLLIILALISLIILPVMSESSAMSSYYEEDYIYERDGIKLIVTFPSNGTPVKSGQDIETIVTLFIDQSYGYVSFEFQVRHNSVVENVIYYENKYDFSYSIDRPKGEVELFDFVAVLNGTELLVMSLEYDVSLDNAAAPYNPYWDEEVKETIREKDEIIEGEKFVKVDLTYLVQLVVGFGVAAALVAFLAVYLPEWTKVVAMEDNFISIINVPIFIFGLGAFSVTTAILAMNLGPQTSIPDFVNSVLLYIIVMVLLVIFFGIYAYSFTKKKIPGERLYAKLIPFEKGKMILALMKHRIYVNSKGEKCIAVKGKGMVRNRMKGRHMLVKGKDDQPIETPNEILYQGQIPFVPVGGWDVRAEKPSEITGIEGMDKKEKEELIEQYKKGKMRRVVEITPSPFTTFGRTYFESLWNFCASEQIREEREKYQRLINAFKAYNKFAKKYSFSEQIHAMFDLTAFDTLENPKQFKKLTRKMQVNLDRIDKEQKDRERDEKKVDSDA